jgi:hypothetical protein
MLLIVAGGRMWTELPGVTVCVIGFLICTVAYVHAMYRLWKRLRASPTGRAGLVSVWAVALTAGEWVCRNSVHAALGLQQSEVPYTYGILSVAAAILIAAVMTVTLLAVLLALHWITRIVVYTMLEYMGIIRFVDWLVRQRAVQFALRLRKGTRLPRPRPDLHAAGLLMGGLLVVSMLAAVLMATAAWSWSHRHAGIRLSVFWLDALEGESGRDSVYERILATGHARLRMRMNRPGTDVVIDSEPAAPPSGASDDERDPRPGVLPPPRNAPGGEPLVR